MRKFDPWPVFFRREFKRNWPFLVGFAVTGTIITKFSLGLTGGREEFSLRAEAREMNHIGIRYSWSESEKRSKFSPMAPDPQDPCNGWARRSIFSFSDVVAGGFEDTTGSNENDRCLEGESHNASNNMVAEKASHGSNKFHSFDEV
ncbi:mitochondrial ATP synthase subunit [Olea europaea subsp. europaea]|uniref:Mitochondrial ATP synthase subunit n=1 Tax=Olea europaea subsp. europaea TaxID=158383 RepID=A0A8S0UPD4_OLEEU|nr:mitochondrial ATP synthase subunit [Olea europaea subsp. europaea]